MSEESGFQAAIFRVAPGGGLRRHPAGDEPQIFAVLDGSGAVSAEDGIEAIVSGEAVFWDEGEEHGMKSETALTALIIESRHLDRFRGDHRLRPKSSSRKGPTMGVDPKVSCEVGPCPDPLSRGDRGKRPVQDGGVARVLIHASGGTQLCCQKAVGRQSGPRTGQERGHRISTRSLDHMAPPVDHLPVGGGAQLLVSMLDDAVLQPRLSG
jgi:mannose-6-phosphate isomerase-like protein (cupin superfamily)